MFELHIKQAYKPIKKAQVKSLSTKLLANLEHKSDSEIF